MTKEEMVAFLLNYIQTDANLLYILKLSAIKNISQLPEERLTEIIAIINHP